ncbi:hypothetical protein KIN20_016487 [Parelaphostrongylus tenuis]|uniref:Uncharacterized protein n=1 Tax=Parelaphostrongylus tenuis TaxID=148309 RepID=A0AAD5MGJ1_PARTN|nr:hypothetical protein KIN20_009323 [Parelaphostrongylus tenuis]KAJ1358157.1 hypothetical protein KIN20_016487 [Parelaphostrongylus tenuis]
MGKKNCIIVENTVTGLCTKVAGDMSCDTAMPDALASVPVSHTSVSGTLITTNFIMAN